MKEGSNNDNNEGILRIGMFGGGTVGGGVYDLLMGRMRNNNTTTNFSGTSSRRPRMIITKICVKSLDKPRDFELDESVTQLVTNVDNILEDESINLIVEVMGGTTLAKEVVTKAIQKGKAVVTANKALIAQFLDEIQELCLKYKTYFKYEAAVCGAIPIINVLQNSYPGDVIHEVMGICNGTTNYILNKMEDDGVSYHKALKEAQDLGFAEADPTADVEGHDVRAKIAILAKLAFGRSIDLQCIPCKGISDISLTDFEYAKLLNCTIKLVGTAARMSQFGEHDGALSVYVTPKMVPLNHMLASVYNASNAVTIHSSNLGSASYTGPGAGRYPTANSVVADICRFVDCKTNNNVNPFPLQSNIEVDNNYTSQFYVRISFQDGLGIIRITGELAEKHGVSINSVLQNPIHNRMAADFVVTTELCRESQVRAFCEDIERQDFTRGSPLYMPLFSEQDTSD